MIQKIISFYFFSFFFYFLLFFWQVWHFEKELIFHRFLNIDQGEQLSNLIEVLDVVRLNDILELFEGVHVEDVSFLTIEDIEGVSDDARLAYAGG